MNLDHALFDSATMLAEQRKLFQLCFPETIGTYIDSHEHYHWKFNSFPGEIKSREYITLNESKILGYYAALPYQYKVRDKIMRAGMVCDVMTHPEAQGKGIFVKTGFFATELLSQDGFDFTTGYPIREAVIPGHLKVGWKIELEMPLYIRIIKANSILKKFRLVAFSCLLNPVLSLYNSLLHAHRKDSAVTIKMFSATNFLQDYRAEYEIFFEKWSEQRDYCLLKSVDFLRWRLGAPEQNYHIAACYKQKNLSAVVIFKIDSLKNVPSLAILDFMTLSADRAILGSVHKALLDAALLHQAETIAVMQSAAIAKQLAMQRYGFIKSPYLFRLIVKKLSDRFNKAQVNYQNAHIMWIDSDDL